MTPTAAPAIDCRVLPLPRVLEDIERRRGARRGPDASVVRVYYLLQLYSSPRGIGELSSAELCGRLNISRKTAALALRRLVALGILRTWHRPNGRVVIVRFLFREIHRLFKKGWTALKHGVLSFSSSYPQVVFPPPYNLMPPQRVKFNSRKDSKDGPPRSPGALLWRLRAVASQHGLETDSRTTTLLRTVGHLVFHGGRFPEFAAAHLAVDELAATMRRRFDDAPPATSPARRLWAWARATVEDALVRARQGRTAEFLTWQAERDALRAATAEPTQRRSEDESPTPEGAAAPSVRAALRELMGGARAGIVSLRDAAADARRAELERQRQLAEKRRAVYGKAPQQRSEEERQRAALDARQKFAAWCAAHPEGVSA